MPAASRALFLSIPLGPVLLLHDELLQPDNLLFRDQEFRAHGRHLGIDQGVHHIDLLRVAATDEQAEDAADRGEHGRHRRNQR